MTEEEFYRIHTFMKKRYGIDMSRKKQIVSGRLDNYLRSRGFRDYTAYMNVVEQDITGQEEKKLVNILTTNHTYFMRESEHFDYLRQVVLPWLKAKEEKRKDLAIWCAASSTGEEPYALAMLLKDFFGFDHTYWDTKILATDVSTEVLQQAMTGMYSLEQIEPLPQTWKRRFLKYHHNQQSYEISQEIKNEVLFRHFNLMNPFPFKRKMHIVFLRNVMFYFDNNTKKELIQKVYDVMEPGGYLFIGRSETIDRSAVGFQLIQPSIFRKEEGMKR